ncbi:EAL and HDOD domain-containing protein [Natronospira bacteriovora]|uniref:EAL domain-containing protein n=1 Tax=Natronospira bacteriovora TaxID=3069753 RepID=A0ABU0W2Z3_9GAMM|nr:EAL domain-containing protein [Natronospira sp. AB-CW4]MDQ2068373.1 EAL domain-containing protein [Natronospira sp. AB-CW4]
MLRTLLSRFRSADKTEAVAGRQEVATDRVKTSSRPSQTNGQTRRQPNLPELFVGRQPIVNNRREIVAWQLLFRNDLLTDAADIHDDVAATGDVLLNTLNNLGLEKVMGNGVAFVKVPAEMLEHPLLEILPQKRVVLDLSSKLVVEQPLMDRLHELKRMGYRFAMTNFRVGHSDPDFLNVIDFAKLSIGDLSDEEARKEVRQLRGRGLRLIAEKVEDADDFKLARSLFMNYYQGYFFARPETLHMRRVDPHAERVSRLFNLVLSDAPRDVVESEFKQDVALSFNILRYINSPGMGLAEEVNSIKHALVMLGKTRLARWLSMMMMRNSKQSVAPRALLRTALIRARTTELLGAAHFGNAQRDHLFMTGMFSLLDVLFGMSLEESVGTLQLPEPIRLALIKREGPYAPYLQLAIACDHFDVEEIRHGSRRLGIPLRQINHFQTEAMTWARQLDEGLNESE